MSPLSKSLLTAALFMSAHAFAQDCTAPATPTLPDGASASLEEMVAGQAAVKSFQADAQAYRECLDGAMQRLRTAAEDGDAEAAEAFKQTTDAYNASVSAEENLATDFNSAIRAYKAANPS